MSKERFIVVGTHTIKDCMNDEYLDLKKSCELLNTIEKALELACDYVRDEYEGTYLGDEAESFGGFEECFKNKAKEMLKNENNNKENNS